MAAPRNDGSSGLIVPRYDDSSLGALLPGVAVALGVENGALPAPGADPAPAVSLPPAPAVCVVLVDGLGAMLLDEAAEAGDAPFLAGLAAARPPGLPAVLRAGCPATTATSMGSFGTGLPPGRHGLVGYQVRDPVRGTLLNHLRWDPYTDPVDWQPHATVFARCAAAGVAVANIGAAEFAGSGLTVAAHRGAAFTGVKELPERVDAALSAATGPGRRLTYLYWGAVDAIGHEHGWRSSQWRAELRHTDAEIARLADGLPRGTLLVITADHGMVDVPHHRRLDIATKPGLRADIAVLGGEPRMVQIYCRGHRAAAVADRFAAELGDRAWVRTRDEAIDEGWFGPVDDRVRPRIGEVLIAARGDFAVVDSQLASAKLLALIGHHGSLTEAEQLVPLLVAQL